MEEKYKLINRSAVRGFMYSKSITGIELAKLLGISYVTLHAKLKGKQQFTEKEIKILLDLIGANIFLS